MEEWRTIKDFEDYQVSSHGRVRSMKGNTVRILTPVLLAFKYYIVNLCKNKIMFTKYIHRLVAEAFLIPIEGKIEVDHINQIKTDNRLENLRWENHSGQMINRNYPVGISGKRNIYERNNSYEVQIRRNKILWSKSFKTLEEAIAHRDEWLTSYNTAQSNNQTSEE
jgi:hypothetical protein